MWEGDKGSGENILDFPSAKNALSPSPQRSKSHLGFKAQLISHLLPEAFQGGTLFSVSCVLLCGTCTSLSAEALAVPWSIHMSVPTQDREGPEEGTHVSTGQLSLQSGILC